MGGGGMYKTHLPPGVSKTRAILQQGAVGSLAAGMCFPIVYPLDVIKKDLQINKISQSYRESVSALYAQGGARRFFRGAHIAMSEVVASRFVSFGMAEAYKNILPAQWNESEVGRFKRGLVSAFLSSWTKAAIFTPLDSIKTRFQTLGRAETNVNNPTTVRTIAAQVYGRDGVRGLYKGFVNLGLKGSLNFVPFYAGMEVVNARVPVPEAFGQRVLRDAGVGSTVTLMSDLLTFPIDTAKNVVQATIMKDATESVGGIKVARATFATVGVWGMLKHPFTHPHAVVPLMRLIYKERGLLGLYRGFVVPTANGYYVPGPRMLSLTIGGAVFGVAYQGMTRALKERDQKRYDDSQASKAA